MISDIVLNQIFLDIPIELAPFKALTILDKAHYILVNCSRSGVGKVLQRFLHYFFNPAHYATKFK